MIFLTGDTHGDFHRFISDQFPEGKYLTKEDYVIIAGDFGGVWNLTKKEEQYWLNWLASKPWTTLFVDGNHENFDELDKLGSEEKFGNRVGILRTAGGYIYHLKRGNIYTIDGINIFTFGGGLSIDKHHRKEGESWWAREYPSQAEIDHAWRSINSEERIDYVITHVPPIYAYPTFSHGDPGGAKTGDLVAHYLNDMYIAIRDREEFKGWYHGHMHYDLSIRPKFRGLYYDILKIGEGFQTPFGDIEND